MSAPIPRTVPANPAPADPADPGQFTDIVGRMKDRLDSFSPAEKRVASIVLSNVPRAAEESIASLAARAGVSEPSVTRFCRAIGCRGIRDFKLKLAQCMVVGEAYLNADAEPATAEADLPAYWGPIMSDAHGALREVERRITPRDIQAAAAALAEAHQVVTVGLGGSAATLAEEAQFRLFRYGVRVSCCPEPYILRMTAATLGPDDLVFAISASGKTEELIEAVGLASAYGARTIAITALGSPLAEVVDHSLCVAVPETQDTLTPTSLRFAYLAIIDLLSAATGYALGPKARENLRRIKYTALNHRAGQVHEPLGD